MEIVRGIAESVVLLTCVCCSCKTFRFDLKGLRCKPRGLFLLYGWRRSRSTK